MRFENCETDGPASIMTAPFERSAPEPDWTAAHESGLLPDALMALYRRAHFLSFGMAPPFLDDSRRHLFSYFGFMLRGIKESLVDATEELAALELAESKVFDRGKEFRCEEWSPDAPRQSKRHFRLLMLSLCSALDCTAELTALILPDAVPGLRLGKAEFAQIESWLVRDAVILPLISTPSQLRGATLHGALRPLVVRADEAKDWLCILRLYRNKSAHLGSAHFREMGFHDSERVFYAFLPTKWPVIWEEHIKLNDPLPSPDPPPLQEIFGPLMLQDKISFVQDLRKAVVQLVAITISHLDFAYSAFHDLPVNADSVAALDKSIKQYDFRAFPE